MSFHSRNLLVSLTHEVNVVNCLCLLVLGWFGLVLNKVIVTVIGEVEKVSHSELSSTSFCMKQFVHPLIISARSPVHTDTPGKHSPAHSVLKYHKAAHIAHIVSPRVSTGQRH